MRPLGEDSTEFDEVSFFGYINVFSREFGTQLKAFHDKQTRLKKLEEKKEAEAKKKEADAAKLKTAVDASPKKTDTKPLSTEPKS